MAYKRPKWQEDFYGGIRWKNCRKAYTAYKNGICEECYKRGVIEPGTVVHHKVHMTSHNVQDDELAYGFDNLMLLCGHCHWEIHQADRAHMKFPKCDAETGKVRAYRGKRRWNVNENGDLIAPPEEK